MVHVYSHLWPGVDGGWSRRAAIDRIDRLSRLLDIAFAIPGTRIRFGIEALLRMIPGVGDVAASALSCWVLYEAARLGVPRPLLLRMIANVLVEAIAGTVPVAGDLFDIAWRANRRNVSLLRNHIESGLRAIADMERTSRDFRVGPITTKVRRSKMVPHSITCRRVVTPFLLRTD